MRNGLSSVSLPHLCVRLAHASVVCTSTQSASSLFLSPKGLGNDRLPTLQPEFGRHVPQEALEGAAEVLNDPPGLVTRFRLGDELPNVLIELLCSRDSRELHGITSSHTLVAVCELLLQQLKSQHEAHERRPCHDLHRMWQALDGRQVGLIVAQNQRCRQQGLAQGHQCQGEEAKLQLEPKTFTLDPKQLRCFLRLFRAVHHGLLCTFLSNLKSVCHSPICSNLHTLTFAPLLLFLHILQPLLLPCCQGVLHTVDDINVPKTWRPKQSPS